MPANIKMEVLRMVGIDDDGDVHFEVLSGNETYFFSQKACVYRRFIADAQRQIDRWMAERNSVMDFRERGHG